MKNPPSIQAHRCAVGGEYRVQVLDGKTRQVRRETPWFDNLITNIGLDRLGSGAQFMQWCRIGTGTTTPADTDTALVSQSASTQTIAAASAVVNAGAPSYQTTSTIVYEFVLGAVVGNMAEVGVGWDTGAASTLFSRARINDAGGLPTTITVLVSEILQVSYRFTVYPQITDATGSIVIAGVTYNYTTRCFNAATVLPFAYNYSFLSSVGSPNVYTGALGSITSAGPAGTVLAISVSALGAYVAGTHYRDVTLTAAIGQGNLAGGLGIRSMSFAAQNTNGWVLYSQTEFVPNIPKTATNALTLTWRLSWARH